MVVAGISEYARRIRELRVQCGVTVKNMDQEDISALFGEEHPRIKLDQYILLSDKEDRDAAFRWNLANGIRKERMGMRDKILKFLRQNVGQEITGEELRYVAGNQTE
ncbi:hypothetical protein AGMMS49925_08230 [Deltaproteobacteria bacterium]|nr:hypothetical protein AGMMS49925_08230 [Deltaproteobacteria bacterium]